VIEPLHAALEVMRRRLDGAGRTPLAVAFSGGGDSLALLLAAKTFARETGRRLLALHVDHGLQTQSGEWAAKSASQAARLEVPFRLLQWRGVKPAAGLPAAARLARHGLIADAAREAGARVVLLGHTLDDQYENVLMREAGAPVGAMAQWSAAPVWPQGRGLFYCRPLLAMRREALREGLAREGLDWIDDPANLDLRSARVRARALIGAGGLTPRVPIVEGIADLARTCRVSAWGSIALNRAELNAAPEAQALRLLQIALCCASGEEALARPARAGGLLRRLRGDDAFTAGLGGARICASMAEVRLTREAGEAARGGMAAADLPPGKPLVWDGRWEIATPDPGWRVQALRGLTKGLEAADAAALRDIPASDRPSLPVLRHADGRVRLVRLASAREGDHIDEADGWVRTLVEHRFKAACGLIEREDDIGTVACMAKFHPPSYVEAEA
jgi:tRNA(Ile)-lysidine synthase